MKRASALAAAVLLLGADRARAANGDKPIAFGAPAGGRGGVDYAYAQDATSLQTNPAGFGFVNDRIDFASAAILEEANFTNGFGRATNSPSWTVLPLYQLGVVMDPT